MRFCVIGLGRFGYKLATTLSENGMEVLAVDSNPKIVASIKDHVTQAICSTITDEASLMSIGVDDIETVIVAMGENFAESVLITAMLKKRLDTKKVIARGINQIHEEILKLVGADRVVMPEQEIGIKLADRLSMQFTDMIRIQGDYAVSLIVAPESFFGRSIGELELFRQFKTTCIGIRNPQNNQIIAIDNSYVIIPGDKLLMAGQKENLEQVAKVR